MRHNRTEGVRYNRANSRIPAPDAFGQAPAERMAVHMLCDTCGRKKAAVFYHEYTGGTVDREAYKQSQYDLLADSVRESLDMELIYKIIREGI